MPPRKQAPKGAPIPGAEKELAPGKTLGAAATLMWSVGASRTLLRKHQQPLFDAIIETPPLKIRPIVCSRRFGKSFTVMAAIEFIARTKPGSIIRLAYPAGTQGQTIVGPNWRRLLQSCPENLRPVDRTATKDGCWIWPQHVGPAGPSSLYMAGTDDAPQRERLRGAGADWIFVDEAGSHDALDYVIDDILGPQVDETSGRIVLFTTPPKSLAHPFVKYWDEGQESGLLVTRTIFDNTHYTPAKLRAICEKANKGATPEEIEHILAGRLEGSATWEREYLCRKVTDKNLRVLPGFNEIAHVKAFDLPAYFQPYVFCDLGFNPDPFAGILCAHDLASDVLYVVDEFVRRRQGSRDIAQNLMRLENLYWPLKHARRYADDPRGEQQLKDLRQDHGYQITQGRKSDGKQGGADRLNNHLAAGRVIIHPRCENLIRQCRDGIWEIKDGSRVDYQRSEELGHLDAVAALAMGLRCVQWGKALEAQAEYEPEGHFVKPTFAAQKPMSKTATTLKAMFRGAYA